MRLLGLVLLAAPALAEPPRTLTLDEAIQLGRERNRDLRATRERLGQLRADVERAWAPLLPTVTAQGKYTINEPVVSFDPAPQTPKRGSLSEKVAQLQAKGAELQEKTIADLYGQNGKTPSEEVVKLAREYAPLAEETKGFCNQNPSADGCAPVLLQRRHQLDFLANALVPLVNPSGWYGLRAARAAAVAEEANVRTAEAQLAVTIATSFYAAAGNDEQVIARRHGVEVTRQGLENAHARLSAGVSTRVDVTRAEQAVVRAEQALREAEDASAAAYRTLATLIQLRDPFRVAGADVPQVIDAAQALVDGGLSLRPEIRALDRTIAAAEERAFAAKLQWLPTLSAFGLFRAFNAAGFAGKPYALAVGAQLDWALFDGGVRLAEQHRAEAMAAEASLRRAQLRDQVSDEVTNLRSALEVKRRAIEAAQREVALATETLALVRVQRDAGTATQLDLLNAQDALLQSEVNVARVRFELGLAYVQLRRASGQLP